MRYATGCLLTALCLVGCLDEQTPEPEPEATADADVEPDGRDGPDAAPETPDLAPSGDRGPRPDGAADAMPDDSDAMPDDSDATPDDSDAMPGDIDQGPPPGPDGTHFIDRGRCFEHTPRCRDMADCDPGLHRACEGGRCQIDMPCGCASDADCAAGDLCVINERVCGICVPAPARCPDGRCPVGDVCVDGFCREDCPGHGDGPPLDCRGEPRLGRCGGAWSYLREVGCVPVDDVSCVEGGNVFERRADCVAHCRGPVACTAIVERTVANTDVRRVECPISHGPGACIALAHCLCELDDPPDRESAREARRGCAMWLTVPRGAITFADFCGDISLAEVMDRMRDSGFIDGVVGPDTRVELSPGCADVMTDRTTGPMCQDGVQNAWETGIDCGSRGCAECP